MRQASLDSGARPSENRSRRVVPRTFASGHEAPVGSGDSAMRDAGPGWAERPTVTPVFRARGVTKVYVMGEMRGARPPRRGPGSLSRRVRGSPRTFRQRQVDPAQYPRRSGHARPAGQSSYRGKELTGRRERELTEYRRYHVGFVFQFYNLIPSLTALENVAVVTDIAREPMRPEEALGLVGLADRLNHFPSQLSGGEQQRVAIARAIAKRPRCCCATSPRGRWTPITGVIVLEALERSTGAAGRPWR